MPQGRHPHGHRTRTRRREYNRQGFVYDIPRLLKGPAVIHPSDPWYKREGSEEPHHVHKEAHTRIGEGLVQLKTPHAVGEGHEAKKLGAGESKAPGAKVAALAAVSPARPLRSAREAGGQGSGALSQAEKARGAGRAPSPPGASPVG